MSIEGPLKICGSDMYESYSFAKASITCVAPSSFVCVLLFSIY